MRKKKISNARYVVEVQLQAIYVHNVELGITAARFTTTAAELGMDNLAGRKPSLHMEMSLTDFHDECLTRYGVRVKDAMNVRQIKRFEQPHQIITTRSLMNIAVGLP